MNNVANFHQTSYRYLKLFSFNIITILSFYSFCSTLSASELDYSTKVSSAFDRIHLEMGDKSTQKWGYQLKEKDLIENESITKLYNPSQTENAGWRLLLVNGRSPSKEQLFTFNKENATEKQEGNQEDNNNEKSVGLSEIINMDTLSLLTKTDDKLIFSFTPIMDDLDDNNLKGQLVTDKSVENIIQLRVSNTEALSPAFSVSIDKFELLMLFSAIKGSKAYLPVSVTTKVIGTIAVFKSINEHEEKLYSQYQQISVSTN